MIDPVNYIGLYVIPAPGNPSALAHGNWKCVGVSGKDILVADCNGLEYKLDPQYIEAVSKKTIYDAIDKLRTAMLEVENAVRVWNNYEEEQKP
jgi:hypothetical protein